jgi:hypothetical protein
MKKKVPEEKKVKVSIAMDPDLLKVIDDLAVLHNRSRSNIVETMIKQELDMGLPQAPHLKNKPRGAGFSIQSKLTHSPAIHAVGVLA